MAVSSTCPELLPSLCTVEHQQLQALHEEFCQQLVGTRYLGQYAKAAIHNRCMTSPRCQREGELDQQVSKTNRLQKFPPLYPPTFPAPLLCFPTPRAGWGGGGSKGSNNSPSVMKVTSDVTRYVPIMNCYLVRVFNGTTDFFNSTICLHLE